MNEMTLLYSPSCWVPGKNRDEVMNDFFAGIKNAFEALKNDEKIPRKENVAYGMGELISLMF